MERVSTTSTSGASRTLTVPRNRRAFDQREPVRALERGDLAVRELGRKRAGLVRVRKRGLVEFQLVQRRDAEDLWRLQRGSCRPDGRGQGMEGRTTLVWRCQRGSPQRVPIGVVM